MFFFCVYYENSKKIIYCISSSDTPGQSRNTAYAVTVHKCVKYGRKLKYNQISYLCYKYRWLVTGKYEFLNTVNIKISAFLDLFPLHIWLVIFIYLFIILYFNIIEKFW